MLAVDDTRQDVSVLAIGGILSGLMRPMRVVRRGLGVLLWTLPCMAIQAVCLLLPGRAKVAHARFYWSTVCRLLGLRVRVIGSAAGSANGRAVVFVANHSSWLDIPVLGGRESACGERAISQLWIVSKEQQDGSACVPKSDLLSSTEGCALYCSLIQSPISFLQ